MGRLDVLRRVARWSILVALVLLQILRIGSFHSIYGSLNDARDSGVKAERVPNPQSVRGFLRGTGRCTNKDISITQYADSSSGIPEYIVQIVNTCSPGCAPSNIHLHCGWFASAKIVNPEIFRRVSYDDCVVNGGKPLKPSQILRFTYRNSFIYPLSFKYARFC